MSPCRLAEILVSCGVVLCGVVAVAPSAVADDARPIDVAARAKQLFRRDNLVAWCIVPFDAKKRGPEEPAAMLEKLGFKHFAYDWRGPHVPTFEQEWDALAKHGVALDAFGVCRPGRSSSSRSGGCRT